LSFAEDKKDESVKPEITVSGQIMPTYSLDLTEGAENFNQFDISRSYLRAEAKMSNWGVRITLDADRQKSQEIDVSSLVGSDAVIEVPADSKMRVFLKHGWIEYRTGVGIKGRFGMIETPLLPFQEKFEGYRWIAKQPMDNFKLLSSADLGVALYGEQAKGMVNWAAGIYNGEGYSSPEVTAGKSMEGRIAVDPMAQQAGKMSLPIVGYIRYSGSGVDGVPATLTWNGGLGYKMKYLTFAGNAFGTSTDGASAFGYSIEGVPKIPKYGFLYVRYDHMDPSKDTEDDGYGYMWAGLGHSFSAGVDFALTYETGMTDVSGDTNTSAIVLHANGVF